MLNVRFGNGQGSATERAALVIRGGVGLFFENVIYDNVLFDRPFRLRQGAFNQVALGCNGGVAARSFRRIRA